MDITITLEVVDQVTSPDTSAIHPAVDYNIVDDMKKVRANISMFELTKIMSQVVIRDLQIRDLVSLMFLSNMYLTH